MFNILINLNFSSLATRIPISIEEILEQQMKTLKPVFFATLITAAILSSSAALANDPVTIIKS